MIDNHVSMPPKKPPPSPLKQQAARRPPPPPPGVKRNAASAAGTSSGIPLAVQIAGVAAAGITIIALIGVGAWLFTRDSSPKVLAVTSHAIPEPDIAAATLPDQPHRQPVAEYSPTGTDPFQPASTTSGGLSVPAPVLPNNSPPFNSPPIAGSAPGSSLFPPGASPRQLPVPNQPSPPDVVSASPPNLTTPTSPPPPAKAPVGPLDELRKLGRYLQLPETKTTASVRLTGLGIETPSQCDLQLLGIDEALAQGTIGRLEQADPDSNTRVWTVMIKPSGGLSKDRPVADFTLAGGELTFQWRPGNPSYPPLGCCLLKVRAAGEEETVQLSRPVQAPPNGLKLGGRIPFSIRLPPGASGPDSPCQIEILPQRFLAVEAKGKSIIEPGETVTLVVTGKSTGPNPVELELDIQCKLVDNELQLAATSFTTPPEGVVRKAGSRQAFKRSFLDAHALQIKAKNAVARARSLKKKLDELKGREDVLSKSASGTSGTRNPQLAEIQAGIRELEPQHDAAENEFNDLDAAAKWCIDMGKLVADLEANATLAFHVFRPVGRDILEIALPQVP